jgi:hypothetical protein
MLGVPTMFVAALLALVSDAKSTASFVAWGFPLGILHLAGATTGFVNFIGAVGGAIAGVL